MNEKKRVELIETARREEENWNKFVEENRIREVHEIHRLGGSSPITNNINKAREAWLREKAPSKVERLEKQREYEREKRRKEEEEIQVMRQIQSAKAKNNEINEDKRQIQLEIDSVM